MELPAIDVTHARLQEKLKRLKNGMTRAEVSQELGGPEFKTEQRDPGQVSFWRFRMIDASNKNDPYEIYMGEFEADKLTFGSILPKG